MVLGPKEFAHRDAERAAQVTNFSINWMREITEQSFVQSRAAMETLLKVAKHSASGMDQQASTVWKSSLHLAEQTLSNAFDLAHRLLHAKDMQEVMQVQADFVGRQAEVVGDQTRELGQVISRGVNEATRYAADTVQRAEAA